ncbi:arrestin-C-like [Heptranchias perlo]|uniref:arrestin-C-like n=1 Tax=Heptranchias perlo TaxID=212740 RepID=UPI003559DA75
MGLSFRKDIYSEAIQVYPPVPDNKRALTQLQERLAKKLGENCYPFFFEIPPNLLCSVTLQPGPEDHGKVNMPLASHHVVNQVTDVVLYQLDKYAKTVCSEEPNDTVAANSTFAKVYSLTPTLANSRQKRCLALDGKLKHEDTILASSTMLRPELDKEVLGILVSYLLKVKMIISRGGILGDLTSSEMAVEIPFFLMHPKSSEDPPQQWETQEEEDVDGNEEEEEEQKLYLLVNYGNDEKDDDEEGDDHGLKPTHDFLHRPPDPSSSVPTASNSTPIITLFFTPLHQLR